MRYLETPLGETRLDFHLLANGLMPSRKIDGILATVFRVEGPIPSLTVDDILQDGALVCGFHAGPDKLCLTAGDRFHWNQRSNESALELLYLSMKQSRHFLKSAVP